MNNSQESLGVAGRIAAAFIKTRLTPLLIAAALMLGVFSVVKLPREEEPQIAVPMFDIFVPFPGAGAAEVEERLVNTGERRLWEIPGVEYIYSTAEANGALFIVRFKVGTNAEEAMTQVFTKVNAHRDMLPPGAGTPLVKARTIDDVPVLALTFRHVTDDIRSLRQAVASVQREITAIPNVAETQIIGGHKREFLVRINPRALAANRLSFTQVADIIRAGNTRVPAGRVTEGDGVTVVETDSLIRDAADLRATVVGISNGRPVRLGDVADVVDGMDEKEQEVYTVETEEGALASAAPRPAVTLSIAKRKGANATTVANEVLRRVRLMEKAGALEQTHFTVTRNYGETAKEKSNELLYHMLLATISVTILIGLLLGVREALVVLVAIPVTLALTLLIYYLFGYTLNRITLFALIFSIGILVDDAIVVVENIHRHCMLDPRRSIAQAAIAAVDEVGNPTILATLAVIAAILPMAFVGGLMGPYMLPIPVGATFAMLFSLAIAFIASPWLFSRILERWKPSAHACRTKQISLWERVYRSIMNALIAGPRLRRWYLVGVAFLVVASVSLVGFKAVRMKMLPFDNKSEFQLVINMPEGVSLARTRQATLDMAQYLKNVPEVENLQCYIGTASPYNFNGLVRHYFLRARADQADIQVNLVHASQRARQSHEIARSVRAPLTEIAARYQARIHVAEVPPGPPVLSTLVIEIYDQDTAVLNALAADITGLLKDTEDVVDVDSYIPRAQPQAVLRVDRQKAALNGIAPAEIAAVTGMALSGADVGLAHVEAEPEAVGINLRLPPHLRSLDALSSLELFSRGGTPVPLGAVTRRDPGTVDLPVYHKNLQKTAYVIAEVAGRSESPVYAILSLRKKIDDLAARRGIVIDQYFTRQPVTATRTAIKWDGEWQVTYEVFRDMGIAFAIVMVLIYLIVVAWFESFLIPLIIMVPIPLTLVGIFPAHWLTGSFFTATSMIGFIAGAGIVVRNSIILVDFIQLRLREGMPLAAAVVDAGAVRFKPMFLTAAAVMVGAGVILFDPIFQGLALSLMTGELAAMLLSLTVVPVLYFMLHRGKSEK